MSRFVAAERRGGDSARRRPIPHATEDFLLHALRYLQPLSEGAIVRGVPTAWAAEPLSAEIAGGDLPLVWPDPRGPARGSAVEPLDERLPQLVVEWPEVARLAALTDAVRLGDTRTREAAARHIRDVLRDTS